MIGRERAGAVRAHDDVELGQLGEPRLDLGLVGDVEVRLATSPSAGGCDRTGWNRRPVASTPPPSSASASAHAAPMPLEPPVTIANLPSSRFTAGSILGARDGRRLVA